MFWFGLVFEAPYQKKVSLQADWMFPSSHLLHSIECNHSSESRLTSLFLLSRSKTTFMRWTGRNTAETFLVRYIQMACVDTNAPSPLTEWSCRKSSFKPSGEFLSLGTHGRHQTFAIWTQGKARPPARGPKIISRPAFPWPSVELPTGSFIFSATSSVLQARWDRILDILHHPASDGTHRKQTWNLTSSGPKESTPQDARCHLLPSFISAIQIPNCIYGEQWETISITQDLIRPQLCVLTGSSQHPQKLNLLDGQWIIQAPYRPLASDLFPLSRSSVPAVKSVAACCRRICFPCFAMLMCLPWAPDRELSENQRSVSWPCQGPVTCWAGWLPWDNHGKSLSRLCWEGCKMPQPRFGCKFVIRAWVAF